jgi:hypothetical protein
VHPGGGRLARFYVGLAHGSMHTCLHEMGKAKAVEAEPHGRSDMWLGPPATTWRVTDLAKLVTPP